MASVSGWRKLRGAAPRAARVAVRLVLRPRASLRLVRTRMRRSLLLRVVAATVALGLLVVLVVGQFLLQRISDGLVSSRLAFVTTDAKNDLQAVNDNFRNTDFKLKQFDVFME